jgi:1-acyl-sn-glycerol-3-phosphate acyltransferase
VILPRRSRLFTALFARHARSRIGRSFDGLRVRGLPAAKEVAARAPVLVVANHTAWWDPLVALHLSQALGVEVYAMMDAANLRALPFFAWLGAFGVDLNDPRDGARAIRFAARLLDRPQRAVWIFPQGAERPITERPLAFRAGSERVARLAKGARVLPIGLRYEHGSAERPVALVSIGAPLGPGAAQSRAVEAELDGIDAAIRGGDLSEFDPVIAGRRSWADAVAEACLASLARRLTG